MAFQAYISVHGVEQGQFKGESTFAKRKDTWTPVVNFSMDLTSARDISTGQPSGKRQWRPVSIVKEWGAASPQGLTACATNETLPEVVVEFTKTNPNGEEYVYQSVRLTNAAIIEVDRFTGEPNAAQQTTGSIGASPPQAVEFERWSFTFQTIEVEDRDGKTVFSDNWSI